MINFGDYTKNVVDLWMTNLKSHYRYIFIYTHFQFELSDQSSIALIFIDPLEHLFD